ncbi:hypothetical protein [Sulfuricurvum sp.]|uniref:hypothetical protein n=1 Tax=Sulfuricurvum sp. TaxID=2025608 RepID=UPI002616595A|nr:hypothetical protein [Sulfuricurvum sp.]MDD2368853.1 hypothetical protein [Sulfuricurvum sp.]MDD3598316.1 hypothetical protein [Sulfuricurvum sp.]
MKILFALSTLIFALHAQSAEMTAREHMSIHTSNARPSAQFQAKQEMHRIHKIDEKQLAQLVQKETGEEMTNEKLTHRGKILYYEVRTANYRLEVNALDGTFLKKEKK